MKSHNMSISYKTGLIVSLVAMLAIFSNCNVPDRNSFAIRDFKRSLQPYLVQVVSTGYVTEDSATRCIELHASDEELRQLSKCEHPLLRTVAFREMLERPEFDHFALIMNNLSDTAMVPVDNGEWGIRYYRVSDDILQNGRWKDTSAKNKTIEKIILDHNYLHSAYTSLTNLEPKEKYYASVKQMATRHRNYDQDVGELNFKEKEYALYGLAKFRKPEDIAFLKETLLSNTWKMTPMSFRMMQDFPHENYMDVYEKYFTRDFYRKICLDRSVNNVAYFVESVSTYKSERSAKILEAILIKKPFVLCAPDSNFLKQTVAYAIWDNDCKAYLSLRKQVEPLIRRYEEERVDMGIPQDWPVQPADKSAEPVRWWH